jgi:hypothetical protein
MDSRSKRARELQAAINDILFQSWDPIGMNDVLPKDEYESYVGSIYRALVDGAKEFRILRLLTQLESSIGCRAPLKRKQEAVRRLCALDVRLPRPRKGAK